MSATRSKAIYALSGLLKHNATAVEDMEDQGGWDVLKAALEGDRSSFSESRSVVMYQTQINFSDPDIAVRKKTMFLLNSLLLSSTETHLLNNDVDGLKTTAAPVHPNSHASMTAESVATFYPTSNGLQKHGILDVLVKALIHPVPREEDEEDTNCTEEAVR